jgi:hemerythrin
MTIHWDSKFEIGHPRIDFEHRIFLDLIIDLGKSAAAGDPRDRLLRIIREIEAYARFHFVSEENIMTDLAYPELEHHQQEHRLLLATLEDKVYEFLHGKLDAGAIVAFSYEWFALHTTQVDKKIAAYIEQRTDR